MTRARTLHIQTVPTHFTKRSEVMGFGEILQWLQDNHMGDIAIEVASTGVEDMTTLRNMSVDLMKTHDISMVNIRRLWEGLHGHEIIEDYDTLPITSRPDLPVLYPGGRGSIKRALDLTVTDRNQALIARLEDDMYAQSSKKPREALWKTWCSMASAWNLPPVPLTEELVVKVGASFKAGHYKSPQNYFSRALQEHRQLTKQHPTPFVQSLIKNVIRSITRGTGPTAFKDSFEVELLNRAYDLISLRREPHHWSEDPSHSRDATLICCWWLLRGIEAAAASTKHVWHQNTRDEHTTFITLPVQKNDTTGACVSRGHSCLCRTAPHLRALTMRWSDTLRLYAIGSQPRSTFPPACLWYQAQTDKPSPRPRSCRSSERPSRKPALPWRDQVPQANHYTGSPNTPAESREHSSSHDWGTPLRQSNWSEGGDQTPSGDTSKKLHCSYNT